MISFSRNFILPLILTSIGTYLFYLAELENNLFSVGWLVGAFGILYLYVKKSKQKRTLHEEEKNLSIEPDYDVTGEPSEKMVWEYKELRKSTSTNYLSIIILLITLIISSIYVITAVQNSFSSVKKAIQGGTLLFSLGIAVIYYLGHKSRFTSLNDKLGFFSGSAFGPPTAIEFLL